ncbi:formate/nitrite transporter family protein [Romboutsia ilealis]|uniref:formate/nitrite transporter family protein n=1 Tax=Romboutsia ilealis TaxID=1115758 RepID=UPI002572BAB3|nr:formate/nitrite transporter family protein [Romboutsia ilealis]
MATVARDIVSKLFASWFSIILFVLCGFEHSIANMFFIPMGILLCANVTIVQLITNLVTATIGNTIGGAILIPCIYNKIFIKT